MTRSNYTSKNIMRWDDRTWEVLPPLTSTQDEPEKIHSEIDSITEQKLINQDNVAVLAEKVLDELKFDQQSSHYKGAEKALKRLIEILTT